MNHYQPSNSRYPDTHLPADNKGADGGTSLDRFLQQIECLARTCSKQAEARLLYLHLFRI